MYVHNEIHCLAPLKGLIPTLHVFMIPGQNLLARGARECAFCVCEQICAAVLVIVNWSVILNCLLAS